MKLASESVPLSTTMLGELKPAKSAQPFESLASCNVIDGPRDLFVRLIGDTHADAASNGRCHNINQRIRGFLVLAKEVQCAGGV